MLVEIGTSFNLKEKNRALKNQTFYKQKNCTKMEKLHYPLPDTVCLVERANLTMELDEILAAGFNRPRQKNFTNVDLWNIHRQRKMNGQRRFLF